MCPYKYYDVMRESKDPTRLRYQMVLSVEKMGLKATARCFKASRNTVRKWHRRWQQHGYAGLRDRSRRPHHSPNATPPQERRKLVELRRTYKRLGAEAIIAIEGLGRSARTIRSAPRRSSLSRASAAARARYARYGVRKAVRAGGGARSTAPSRICGR